MSQHKTSLVTPLTVQCECFRLVSSVPPCGSAIPWNSESSKPSHWTGEEFRRWYTPFLIMSAQGWQTPLMLTFHWQEQPFGTLQREGRLGYVATVQTVLLARSLAIPSLPLELLSILQDSIHPSNTTSPAKLSLMSQTELTDLFFSFPLHSSQLESTSGAQVSDLFWCLSPQERGLCLTQLRVTGDN